MTQYLLKIFEDAKHEKFRVIDKDGEPWFVLHEICSELEITNVSDAANRLDADEKEFVKFVGSAKQVIIINESGLYNLIIGSRKPEAKKFKKWITSEVLPSIRKSKGYGASVPAFIKRANDNWDRTDAGYFSVINELAVIVWGRLERVGHIMADKAPDGKQLRPDVSVGQGYAAWLAKHHPRQSKNFRSYTHTTPEWEGDARQYPNSMLGLFREYVDTVWWPECFENYIKKRDPAALAYLPKLLPPKNKAS